MIGDTEQTDRNWETHRHRLNAFTYGNDKKEAETIRKVRKEEKRQSETDWPSIMDANRDRQSEWLRQTEKTRFRWSLNADTVPGPDARRMNGPVPAAK